jgi:hypothetical protein
MPSIIDLLATTQGRADEAPNIALAEKVAEKKDKNAVSELVNHLQHKTQAVRSDIIKVLYEIGERKPALILPYLNTFLDLLHHKDNRMRWGAMNCLSAISKSRPDMMVNHLPLILEAMDTGSVITRDHGIYILHDVARLPDFHHDAMELLLEQVEKAPVNQVPMYAEKTSEVISKPYVRKLEQILLARKDVMTIPSKHKRITRLVKTLKARF